MPGLLYKLSGTLASAFALAMFKKRTNLTLRASILVSMCELF